MGLGCRLGDCGGGLVRWFVGGEGVEGVLAANDVEDEGGWKAACAKCCAPMMASCSFCGVCACVHE